MTSMDYADKISKLLQKAESTTPQEAEALRDKAYELMATYAVSQAEIDSRRTDKRVVEQIITRNINITGNFRHGLHLMSAAVVNAFETMSSYYTPDTDIPIRSTDGSKVRFAKAHIFYIVGYESDVEQAMLMVTSLQLQAAAAMSDWWRTFAHKDLLGRGPAYRAKRQFIISFGSGAAQKIRLSVRRARAGASSGAELVLFDKKQAVDRFIDDNLNLITKKDRHKGGTWEAGNAGYDAGQLANTGDTGVGGDRKKRINS